MVVDVSAVEAKTVFPMVAIYEEPSLDERMNEEYPFSGCQITLQLSAKWPKLHAVHEWLPAFVHETFEDRNSIIEYSNIIQHLNINGYLPFPKLVNPHVQH